MTTETLEPTFWNGEPTPAERVVVRIADAPEFAHYWAREQGLVGTMRRAVKVSYGQQVFYLDDEDPDGCGWAKVTRGGGGPEYGHRNLSVDEGIPTVKGK